MHTRPLTRTALGSTLLAGTLICGVATAGVTPAAAVESGSSSTPRTQESPAATPVSPADSGLVLSTAERLATSALTPREAAALRPTLKYRSRGPAVVYVQQALSVTPASGYFGPLTRAAVKKLQRKHGLSASGTVGPKTWALILADAPAEPTPDPSPPTPEEAAAAKPTLRYGMGPANSAVVYLQQYLSVSPQSGYFGPLTRTAVRTYQKGMGISATGVVGPLTWTAILAGKRPGDTPAKKPVDDDPAKDPKYTPPADPNRAEKALAFAMAQVGERYVLGGNGPNVWDCSGLVQQAYLTVGIRLPRLASQQRLVGTPVTLDELAPGDLLYYQDGPSPRRGHIAIYAGNGRAVEAANPRRGVRVRDLYESWYAKRFVNAVRVA